MPDKFESGVAIGDATIATAADAVEAAEAFLQQVGDRIAALCCRDDNIVLRAVDEHQVAAHGYAWIAAYVATLEATLVWAQSLDAAGRFGRLEALLLEIGFAEYLSQIGHGIAMSQDEIIRPDAFGVEQEAMAFLRNRAVARLRTAGLGTAPRQALMALIRQTGPDAITEAADVGDETSGMIRRQFQAFAKKRVAPFAPIWHGQDELIPLDLVAELADLGVFGLTTPETFGGSALGTPSMCIVTEELSRGYIGVGSLGTRSEIASELIRLAGTSEQKAKWLPRIAAGSVLPTAVFTEPNTGSDLARLSTRAELDGDVYRLYGAKTWITHAARADLMMILARTGSADSGHRGLTMFLAEKPRGTDAEPFPAPGMSGGEIRVLGYRGMKEYELAFDGFEVPAANVLGGVEGAGFKQLMATFELARIQTAARALGVSQNAFELGYDYACSRIQFGRPLIEFPRVFGKLAWMTVETTMVRQLVYDVARKKDTGVRCDIEAGMAKLLAARVAWSAADNALQVHGGNGYALEYPISRVFCDARILSIFEGAAEIQANVIARGLLSRYLSRKTGTSPRT